MFRSVIQQAESGELRQISPISFSNLAGKEGVLRGTLSLSRWVARHIGLSSVGSIGKRKQQGQS